MEIRRGYLITDPNKYGFHEVKENDTWLGSFQTLSGARQFADCIVETGTHQLG